jgi:4-alpha-glucanotransferase
MRVTFRLRFHTNFGQTLWLLGDHPLLGGGDAERAIPLDYLSPQFWQTTLILPRADAPNAGMVYNYVLRNPDGSRVYDWGGDRSINPALVGPEEILVIDSWNDAGSSRMCSIPSRSNEYCGKKPPSPSRRHLRRRLIPLE